MSNMPVYPSFKPLTIEEKPLFAAAFGKGYSEVSDLSFVSFYAWREIEKNEFSLLDDLIIVKQTASVRPQFYEPVGAGDKKAAIIRVLREQGGSFSGVGQDTARSFAGVSGFLVEARREHFDYLYRVEDLLLLRGAKYHSKRNLIHRFNEEHHYEYVTFNAANAQDCLNFEDAWCDIKGCDRDAGLSAERRVIKAMVEDFARLDLVGAGIRIDGKLCAMLLAGRLNRDTLAGHIIKAYADIPGLYQTMLNEFLRRQARGFTYFNMEDDLGIEGLRKAKLSYHPVRLIEKYDITRPQA